MASSSAKDPGCSRWNAPVAVDDDVLTAIHTVDRQAELLRSGMGKARLSAVANLLEQKFNSIRSGADSSAPDVDLDAEVDVTTATVTATSTSATANTANTSSEAQMPSNAPSIQTAPAVSSTGNCIRFT